MLIHEARLEFQLVHYGDAEPLTSTHRLLAYLATGLAAGSAQSFWLVCMNPKRRPVCRLRLKDGPLVAACVDLREVSRAILLTEARAVACLRTEPTGPVRPQAADEQLIARLRGFCPQLNVEFADYLIAMLDDSDYYSWRDDQARFR